MQVSDVLRVKLHIAVPPGSGPNGCDLLGEPDGTAVARSVSSGPRDTGPSAVRYAVTARAARGWFVS
jgi:hypothetical protein